MRVGVSYQTSTEELSFEKIHSIISYTATFFVYSYPKRYKHFFDFGWNSMSSCIDSLSFQITQNLISYKANLLCELTQYMIEWPTVAKLFWYNCFFIIIGTLCQLVFIACLFR